MKTENKKYQGYFIEKKLLNVTRFAYVISKGFSEAAFFTFRSK
jgi:hypothetical protein